MGWLGFLAAVCPNYSCCCWHTPVALPNLSIVKTTSVRATNDDGVIRTYDVEARENQRRSVRVVVVSDTHGRHESLSMPKTGDVLIHCGDFSNHNQCTPERVREFDTWLGTLKQFKEKIVVFGNHETAFDRTATTLRLRNATVLFGTKSGTIEVVGGLRIFGAPYRPARGCFYRANAFGRSRAFLEREWARGLRRRDDIDVVVTHGPPVGIMDLEKPGHIGDPELLERVIEARPSLHCFGHVHHGRGVRRYTAAGGRAIFFANAASLPGDKKHVAVQPPMVFDIVPKRHVNDE